MVTDTCRSQPEFCIRDPVTTLMMTKNQMNFALKLFKHSSPVNESHLLSPFAIISALSILYQGAAGDTQVEMTKIGGGQSAQIFDNYPYCVIHYLNSDEGNNSIVEGSSRLWAQLNFLINPSFQNIISMLHSIKIKHLNFSHGDNNSLAKAARQWLFGKDYNRANNVIVINFGLSLFLINELHLKFERKYQFVLLKYQPYFIRSSSQKIKTEMIGRTAEFPYYEDQNVQVISLPLQESEMYMMIILPKILNGLPEIENELTGEKLLDYIVALDASNKSIKTMITMPKFFSIKCINLSDGLKSIGLLSMFTESANFTTISD
ncbi:putative serpin-like protein [Dirofilaria immitis]